MKINIFVLTLFVAILGACASADLSRVPSSASGTKSDGVVANNLPTSIDLPKQDFKLKCQVSFSVQIQSDYSSITGEFDISKSDFQPRRSDVYIVFDQQFWSTVKIVSRRGKIEDKDLYAGHSLDLTIGQFKKQGKDVLFAKTMLNLAEKVKETTYFFTTMNDFESDVIPSFSLFTSLRKAKNKVKGSFRNNETYALTLECKP